MPGTHENGSGESRLDRLEGLMALLIEDHVRFSDEHKQLLTAQILLTDRVAKLAGTLVPQSRNSRPHSGTRMSD
jgi:hypothetical protein